MRKSNLWEQKKSELQHTIDAIEKIEQKLLRKIGGKEISDAIWV